LAKRAEKDKAGSLPVEVKKTDDVNWFGVKIGSENSAPIGGGEDSGGVGKYLNLKRPYGGSIAGEESKKKRKLGFGDFEGW
jgi:peptidyl-prolyl cis-trans isomerase-like protein 2